MRLAGLPASQGRALGDAFLYEPWNHVAPSSPESASVAGELARFRGSVERTRAQLSELVVSRADLGEDMTSIFEAQRSMLDDPEWVDVIERRIDSGGMSASEAVLAVSRELAEEVFSLDDEYLRARGDDLLDLGMRVRSHLDSNLSRREVKPSQTGRPVVVVAHSLVPSDTIEFDPSVVGGIVTETGGRNSHSAILARRLGIPAVVSVRNLMAKVTDGMAIVVDGTAGEVILDPDQQVTAALESHVAMEIERFIIKEQVRTAGATPIQVLANAGSVNDVERAIESGADGIGLYRTEFLFFETGRIPNEEEQHAAYSAAAVAAGGRPIVFRTLDVGGDKPPPGAAGFAEPNPFLGVRGIRYSFKEPELFEAQLRALFTTAASFPNVKVMLPMITSIDELERVALISKRIGPADNIGMGAMIEVPSAALLVEEILSYVDFVSVGTNDLTQYILAADRNNGAVSDVYDELHPSVLRTLQAIAAAGSRVDKPVSICGEIAAREEAVALLVGLGYRALSVDAAAVPAIKAAVMSVQDADAAELASVAVRSSRATEVHELLLRSDAAADPTSGGGRA